MDVAGLPRLMVAIGQVRSVERALELIVSGLAKDSDVVLTRIWLIGPGDLCASCRLRPVCPDQGRCLHLAASGGSARGGAADYSRLSGAFCRIPIGFRKVGGIAKDRVGRLLLGADKEWADPAWVEREEVQAFAGEPLIFEGELLGVLG